MRGGKRKSIKQQQQRRGKWRRLKKEDIMVVGEMVRYEESKGARSKILRGSWGVRLGGGVLSDLTRRKRKKAHALCLC